MSAVAAPSEAADDLKVASAAIAEPVLPSKIRPYYALLQRSCQFFFIHFFRGRAFGRENVPLTGGVLLVCNHQSFFDPPLVGLPLHRECSYMARDTLFRNRWFGRLIRSLNAFPVKRGTSDVGALKEGLRRLKSGKALVIFPEGTRTRDGSLGKFHLGPLLLAQRTGVPIVPVVISGAYECWPRQSRWPRLHAIRLIYGKPLPAAEVRRRPPEDLSRELHQRMTAMLTDPRLRS